MTNLSLAIERLWRRGKTAEVIASRLHLNPIYVKEMMAFFAQEDERIFSAMRGDKTVKDLIDETFARPELKERGGKTKGAGKPGSDDIGPHNKRLAGLVRVI